MTQVETDDEVIVSRKIWESLLTRLKRAEEENETFIQTILELQVRPAILEKKNAFLERRLRNAKCRIKYKMSSFRIPRETIEEREM